MYFWVKILTKMLFSTDFIEFDPKKKDKNWMQRVITQFRMTSYKSLYDYNRARKNRSIVNSEQSMENIKKMFKNHDDLEKAGFEFLSIAVMEKIRNILTAEKMKAEIKAYVDAQDPSMSRLKKEDKNLLKNKKMIDSVVNDVQKSIGLPPKNISNEDFNGNYDDFEAMGFDQEEPMDIESFFEYFYQLDTEIDFQKVINHVFNVNAVQDYTHLFLEDAMAIKTLACQQYVSKTTGQITWRRIPAENIWVIKGGNSSNQKEDVAIGYYDTITVSEFIRRAGDDFNFVDQFMFIIQGVNYKGNRISGVQMSEDVILGEKGSEVTYSQLLTFKVEIGYIEFKSIDSDTYKAFQNKLGNTKLYEMRDDDTKGQNEYQKVSDFRERTYYSYFLATNNYDQYVYDGGLLYHQETEGQEDEYSASSIKYIQMQGKSIAEVALPWIEMAQEAFSKFRYLLRDAKKDGRSYNLESLMEVAKQFSGGVTPASLQQTLSKFEESVNDIYSWPRDPDGSIITVQGGVNFERVNTHDTKFTSYKDIVSWAVEMIKNDIGINDMREGATPTTNDVYKLEQASLQQSSNATYYIDNMFDYIYRNSAISTLSVFQDIIRFKSSLPYKYFLNVIGEDGCKRIEALPKISPHRMDIYVSSYANSSDRIRVMQDTQVAFDKGFLSYQDKVLIDNTNDHRKAQKLLVIKQAKAAKELQKQEELKHNRLLEVENTKTENELKRIDRKGGWELKKAQAMADGYYRASQANADAKANSEATKIQAEKDKINLEYQEEQRAAMGA